MLVLDTSVLSASERGDAYQSSVSQNCTTSAALSESPESLWAQIHAYDLRPAKVLTIDASGTTLRRTPRMSRAMNWQGDGASYAFHVDYEQLDVPMDIIHTAARNLRALIVPAAEDQRRRVSDKSSGYPHADSRAMAVGDSPSTSEKR